jgi:serine/threonine protein kinase
MSNEIISVQSGAYGIVEIRNDQTVQKKFTDKYTGMLLKEVSFLRMLNESVIKVDTDNKESKFIMPYLGIPLIKYSDTEQFGDNKLFMHSVMKQFLIKIMKYHTIGIFHCDLMDKNVLWDRRSETVNIIDFGLSMFCIEDMTENFYEIYTSYYKDPVRRIKDKEISRKQDDDDSIGEINEFLPVSYQDDIWAFGMYMYRMMAHNRTDEVLCRIPEDVDVDWIANKIKIPQFAYLLSKCFANREDRLNACDLLQLIPLYSNMGEIEILTNKIINLRVNYTINYKEIFDNFSVEKMESSKFYFQRLSFWFNEINSNNWIAQCISINILLKYLEKDQFIYKDINESTKFRKHRYLNLIIGMITCLSLEMFGDSGLTRLFHTKYDKFLDTLYNDIIKSLFPNYIFFPIYKNYHKDLIDYTLYITLPK